MHGGRALICSYYLPQTDLDSSSRRLFHAVEYLQEAGWQVTAAAKNPARVERNGRLLRQRGIPVYAPLDDDIEAMIEVGQFDLAILGFWHIAEPLIEAFRRLSPRTRIIVDSMDVHFVRHARRIFNPTLDDRPSRVLDAEFATDMMREINAYAAADAVLTVSQKEADLINDLIGDPGLAHVVPDGEDLEAKSLSFEERRGMVFIGNFEHPPNRDALSYLCREIVPRLDDKLLAAHPVYVVGNELTPEVQKYGRGLRNVRMVGWVPSVVPYLERARISVIPLLYGAGTKRKLIQTLMMGTPAVCTSISLEGLPLKRGEHVLVADDPASFAAAITTSSTDAGLWERLAAEGRKGITPYHSRAVARSKLMGVLAEVLAKPAKAQPVAESSAASSVRLRSADTSEPGRERIEPVVRRSVEAPPPALVNRTPIDLEEAAEPLSEHRNGKIVSELLPKRVSLSTRSTDGPGVSIIIPTSNRAALLDAALVSLTEQSVPVHLYEVIVVDDGSTDQTAQVCEDHSTRLPLHYHPIERSGIAAAKNVGIAAARAPVLLFFDDDDVAHPDLLHEHLSAHEENPSEAVAVLGYTVWAPWLEVTPVMHFITDVGHYLFSYSKLADGQRLDFTYFWGGRSSCKRSLLEKGGVFRPEFRFGCEDIELGYRLSRLGLEVVFRQSAMQFMNRPITYDEFCRRCERQGVAQWVFSRMHAAPGVQDFCQTTEAEEKWQAIQPEFAERVGEVHELEAALAARGAMPGHRLLEELHRRYWWTFDAFKIKGMVEACRSAELTTPRLSTISGERVQETQTQEAG